MKFTGVAKAAKPGPARGWSKPRYQETRDEIGRSGAALHVAGQPKQR